MKGCEASKMNNIQEKDKKYIAGTYNRNPVCLISGNGSTAISDDGKEYIDFTSGIGVNSFGYSDEVWADAVSAQAKKLQHTSNLYYTSPCAILAEKLMERTKMNKVFFANSGAEANEGAIKFARKYSVTKYNDNRNVVISLKNSFHGRTLATLTATGQEVFHKYFGPFSEGFLYAEADDFEVFSKLLTSDVCAVIIEFIQGEGGVVPLNKEFVNKLYDYCNKNDIVFIADEVQTGVGRTGKFLCSENYGVKPDITTLAKGLGGGLPIGAVLMNEKFSEVIAYSDHGSTFGGNPVCCAGAITVTDRIDDTFLADVVKKGEYIKEKLEGCGEVESITGMGLMLGIELKNLKASDVVATALEKGLMLLTAKTKVRLLPPLNITYEEIDKGLEILIDILS